MNSYNSVNGVAENLPQSYLNQRQQVVDFNSFISDTLEIQTGLPQSSVLGFVFLVYINNLLSCRPTDLFNMIMYADHTTLFFDITEAPADMYLIEF